MEMENALEEPDSTFAYVASATDEIDLNDPRIDDLFALEAALKTQYKEDVEACAIKEVQNVVKHKTWRYLKSVADAEQSIHTNVLPCQMVVKDKRDSKGQLLLPFDKTSPTATIDAVWAFLAVAQRNRMQVESNDVPAAYLQPDGSLLVQLERALYGLPEAGKLWHEYFTDIRHSRPIA